MSQPKLLIRRLAVRGLLSFGQTQTFELGALNVLVGPNGAGKSNFISLLRILQAAPSDIQDAFVDSGFESWRYQGGLDETVDWPDYFRGFGADTLSGMFLAVQVGIEQDQQTLEHWLEFRVKEETVATFSEQIVALDRNYKSARLGFLYSRDYGLPSRVGSKEIAERGMMGEEPDIDPSKSVLSQLRSRYRYPEITDLATLYSRVKIYSEWVFGAASPLRESTTTDSSDTALAEDLSNFALALNAHQGTVVHDRIINVLRELKTTYRDYITRILFGRVGLELREDSLSKSIPAKRLSDGTLRFLALAAILCNENPPPLICIEEPELGMHPDMIRLVADMIADAATRTQVIITTHSDHLLTALQDRFDVLFAFDSGPNGSVVKTFTQEEYKEWRSDHDLGELWTSGEIGGVRY